jgi:hypothetical protein
MHAPSLERLITAAALTLVTAAPLSAGAAPDTRSLAQAESGGTSTGGSTGTGSTGHKGKKHKKSGDSDTSSTTNGSGTGSGAASGGSSGSAKGTGGSGAR